MSTVRIDPPSWFVGMEDPVLQLMLTGEDIDSAEIVVCYPCIETIDIIRCVGRGYAFVYLNLAHCVAGDMEIIIRKGENTQRIPYTLRQKELRGCDRKSLTAADVVYLLMPDRFARNSAAAVHNSYRGRWLPSVWQGGDLEGIRTHLSYLSDLGVTALWLTPVLQNNMPETSTTSSYHGYAVTDYYAIDPHFGTYEDYQRLVRDTHSRNMKVVMDFIFNHCGAAHPWLSAPPMDDWFNHREWLDGVDVAGGILPKTDKRYLQTNYRLTTTVDPYVTEVDKKQTIEGWFVKNMPDLNMRNKHLARYLTQCTMWWVESANIDAIRMDTFPYVDKEAMRQWLKAIHREYPHFKVIGETWYTDSAFIAQWQDVGLDSSMDFALFEAFAKSRDEDSRDMWSGVNRIYHVLCNDYLYKNPSMTLAFLENHDVNRFLGDYDKCDTKRRKVLIDTLKRALALLLTMPRLPQLYYGTEVLMCGTTAVSDGYVRRPFPGGFPCDPFDAFTKSGRTREQNAMYVWLRRILRWRQGCKAVAMGETKHYIPRDGIYVMARIHHTGRVITIVNGSDHSSVFYPERYEEVLCGAQRARDITTGRDFPLTYPTRLMPRKAVILEIKEE